MLPPRFCWILLILRTIKWMIAIRPNNSPLYAFATSSSFEKNPTTLPHPFLHSRTKAAEHKVGYSSLIYEPSVTATVVPSEIDYSIQANPPDTDMCSHSHVFPQDCSTSKNMDSVGFCITHGAVERRCQCSPSRVSCTEHIILCSWLGLLWEYVNQFGFRPETNTSSDLPSMFLQ
jgi:hypothetical protein